ncbi:hypothetical protein ACE6H2_006755 [Prunus campanulata]
MGFFKDHKGEVDLELRLGHLLQRELEVIINMRAGSADFTKFKWELEAAVSELADSNCQLATLKAESDAAKGAVFPVLNFGNKHVDRVRDKQKDLIYGVYPQGANGIVLPFISLIHF